MPDGRPSTAIARFSEYASAVGHVHEGEVSGFADIHGRETISHHYRTQTGVSYIAQISPAADYGLITAHYNVFTDIANQLPESELEDLANTDHGYKEHEDEHVHRVGARALLLHCEDDDLEAATESVKEVLQSQDIVYSAHTTDEKDALHHFFVHQRVFPYHDSFTPARFNEAVRTVTHYREKAMAAYYEHVELPIDESHSEKPAETETDEGIGRDQQFQ